MPVAVRAPAIDVVLTVVLTGALLLEEPAEAPGFLTGAPALLLAPAPDLPGAAAAGLHVLWYGVPPTLT